MEAKKVARKNHNSEDVQIIDHSNNQHYENSQWLSMETLNLAICSGDCASFVKIEIWKSRMMKSSWRQKKIRKLTSHLHQVVGHNSSKYLMTLTPKWKKLNHKTRPVAFRKHLGDYYYVYVTQDFYFVNFCKFYVPYGLDAIATMSIIKILNGSAWGRLTIWSTDYLLFLITDEEGRNYLHRWVGRLVFRDIVNPTDILRVCCCYYKMLQHYQEYSYGSNEKNRLTGNSSSSSHTESTNLAVSAVTV